MIFNGIRNPNYSQTNFNNRLGYLNRETFELSADVNIIAVQINSTRENFDANQYARLVFKNGEDYI